MAVGWFVRRAGGRRNPTTTCATVEDALLVARNNMDVSRELASRGPGYVMVAEVRPARGGYELKAVVVIPEFRWTSTPYRHVVKRVDGHTCPVCGRQMTDEGVRVRPRTAAGGFVSGLDPANCVGCHDTMTTHGIAPRYWIEKRKSVQIPRPR